MPSSGGHRRPLPALGGALLLLFAIGTPSPAYDLADPLPVDSAVLRGQLDNGLRYLIRENDRPEARADLRLVVKAGSVDEDEDQRGLAHFVEHMLFNGTESYEGNEIIHYLESIGARFGADLNAYTSFDETVYMLHIPTDTEGLLEEGLRIFGEFAAKATLSTEEIEKERGVVLDEWRRRLGAGQRTFEQQMPVLLKGSRYAERMPIGLPEVIEECDPEAIRRYYRDWYRPERMAVVAVGDFDAAEVEADIREIFGAIPGTPQLRPAVEWDVPADPDTLFALADDPELGGTSITLSRKTTPEPPEQTYGAYREDLVARLAGRMFASRLADLSQSDDPPFFGAGRSGSTFGTKGETSDLRVRIADGEEVSGLEAVLLEEKRVLQHGFTGSELDRARRSMLAGIEATWAERDKTGSGAYVGEYTRHFLDEEPIPGIEREFEIWKAELPTITLEECLEAFREDAGDGGVVVLVSRPTREDLVGEAEIQAMLRRVAHTEVEPYVDPVANVPLVAHRPPAATVVRRHEIPEIGVTEVDLSNGVHLILKPTDFQDDTVVFELVAMGGTSQADLADLPSASFASGIVAEAGWGGHSRPELKRLLTGKVASSSPYFYERQHGVSGSSTVADLGTALDLAVVQMTSPNRDEDAFERFRTRLASRLANRHTDPGVKYGDRLTAINTQDHPRSRPMTAERLDEIDLDRALDFYRACFANASDFTMFVTGNLDVDAVIAQIASTIGTLPSTDRKPTHWVDREVLFPPGVTRETVRAGSEPKSSTTITIASYDGPDPFEWHRLRTAGSILERRLLERLREDRGATYGVGVGYAWSMLGPARGVFRVRFGCDPADAEALGQEVFRTIRELQEEGPTAAEVATEQEIQTRELESSLEQNGYWLGSLFALWATDRPLTEIGVRQQRIDDLDAESLHRMFRDHFDLERYTWIDWHPQVDG